MSDQIENLYRLMCLRATLQAFGEQLENHVAKTENLRKRFLFPQRAFRGVGVKLGYTYYPPTVWHLPNPQHGTERPWACCGRLTPIERETEWKDLADIEDSDNLCSICFRPILRPQEE